MLSDAHYGLLLMEFPTLFNVFETELPRKCRATIATTAMRASSNAYSTKLAPDSLLRFHRARIGSAIRTTNAMMFTGTPLLSSTSWFLCHYHLVDTARRLWAAGLNISPLTREQVIDAQCSRPSNDDKQRGHDAEDHGKEHFDGRLLRLLLSELVAAYSHIAGLRPQNRPY